MNGIYLAFLSALAIWGWIELAFLSGVITGPNRAPAGRDLPMGERFIAALGTILWHELLLVGTLVVMAVQTQEAANPFALYTFLVLFFARISAKLNLFFGVPNINVEFLPRPLAHLASHFRVARMTAVFPVSVTLLTLAVGCWTERALSADGLGPSIGFWLLTALTALALLEHWFMVLRLQDQKLWRWMMPAPKHPTLPTHQLATSAPALLKEKPHGL